MKNALTFIALLTALLLIGCDNPEDGGDTGNDDTSVGLDTSTAEDGDTGGGTTDATEEETSETDTTESDGDTSSPEDGDTATTDQETSETDATEDAASDVPIGCGTGNIKGRVCSPLGTVWLSDVEVSVEAIDCDGNDVFVQAFSDEDGFYELRGVPSGLHTLKISTGSYTTSIDDVTVKDGETTDLTGALTKTCLDTRAARIAVLGGSFDHLETVLTDLGINHDYFVGDATDQHLGSGGLEQHTYKGLLNNRNELLSYDILFINCGLWSSLSNGDDGTLFSDRDSATLRTMVNNLLAFVNSGGSIYISDYAYFWGELTFPGAIDFYGDDSIEGPAKRGNDTDNLVANIESALFRKAIRKDTMTIKFDLPAWVVAEKLGTPMPGGSVVHIRAPYVELTDTSVIEGVPLVLSFKPSPDSGTVYFTSFHHERELNPDMESVLNFLIFQL